VVHLLKANNVAKAAQFGKGTNPKQSKVFLRLQDGHFSALIPDTPSFRACVAGDELLLLDARKDVMTGRCGFVFS
jgi:hypothetical protein